MYIVQPFRIGPKSESMGVLTSGSVKVTVERIHLGPFSQEVAKVSIAVYATMHLLATSLGKMVHMYTT